jgi:nucleoside-diphosphate-sugar epimerase
MQALVTGANGFVGRHLVARLREEYTVTEIDVCGPERSRCDCRHFFRHGNRRFDLIFHCAAEVGGRVGIDFNAAQLGAVNLQLDGAMWEWALRVRPGRVVYFSSAAAYPVWRQLRVGAARLTEDCGGPGYLGMPDESYGWVKLTGELMASRVRAAGVPVTVVRPFSMYDFDQDDDYPFPQFAKRAARHDDPFTVWGDGRQVRDLVHIDDAVAAILALVENEVDGPVNLCTGIGTSMDDLAILAMVAAGNSDCYTVRHLTDKPEGVRYRVGDPTLLNRYYTPTITVAEGMRRAVQAASGRTKAAA